MTTLTTTDRIKKIQKHLDLEPDGLIGPATLTAIEDRLFDEGDIKDNAYSLIISRAGMEQLVQHEIVSKSYYNRRLKQPVWPGGASGVTIGIGYDLGYNRVAQIQQDWSGKVSDADLKKLKSVSGKKGDEAKRAAKRLKTVTVSYENAKEVFSISTLPRYAASTAKAYPGVEKLFPDAQAALLSLVYNRGARMSGGTRKEMAAIRPLVLQQGYEGIAQEMLNMKRLWVNRGLAGLLKRRDDEAAMVRHADRQYDDSELIRV